MIKKLVGQFKGNHRLTNMNQQELDQNRTTVAYKPRVSNKYANKKPLYRHRQLNFNTPQGLQILLDSKKKRDCLRLHSNLRNNILPYNPLKIALPSKVKSKVKKVSPPITRWTTSIYRRSAAINILSRMPPAELLRMHMIANVIPKLVPALYMGFMYWSCTPDFELFYDSDFEESNNTVPSTTDSQNIGSTSRSLDNLESSTSTKKVELTGDNQRNYKDLLHAPESKNPDKIALWMSTLIIATAVLTFKVIAIKCK